MGNSIDCLKGRYISNSDIQGSIHLEKCPQIYKTFEKFEGNTKRKTRIKSLGSFHYENGLISTKINEIYNSYSPAPNPFANQQEELSPCESRSKTAYSMEKKSEQIANFYNKDKIISIIDRSYACSCLENKKKYELELEQIFLTKEIIDYLALTISKLDQGIVELKFNMQKINLNDDLLIKLINSLAEKKFNLTSIYFDLSRNHIAYQSSRLFSQYIISNPLAQYLYLDLSYNTELSGNGLEEIAEKISNLNNLTKFHLDLQSTKISISDFFFYELKESCNHFKNLAHLSLNFAKNNLKKNIIDVFITGLKKIDKLESFALDLSYNNLKTDNLFDLSCFLRECSVLKKLELTFIECGLSVSDFEVLYMGLARLPKLNEMLINCQKNSCFSEKENFVVDYVNPEISFKNLQVFQLNSSFNICKEINFENLGYFFLCFQELVTLELNLNAVLLNENGIEKLICSLVNLKKIKKISLNMNNSEIKPNSLLLLGVNLGWIHNLEIFNLLFKNNNVTEGDILKFLSSFQSMTKLQKLKLDISDKIINNSFQRKIIIVVKDIKLLQKFKVKMASDPKSSKVFNTFELVLIKRRSIIKSIDLLKRIGWNKKCIIEMLENSFIL